MDEALDTAIAIVGMSGRFPGARDLRQFWHNLRNGVESVRRLSDDELRQNRVPRHVRDDATYVRAAATIENVEEFDAGFFGLSPRQAALTDPQHRVFLECAFEALEDAGYHSERDQGPVGVFTACGMSHYLLSALASKLRVTGADEALATYIANDKDYLATQVSYHFDLQGPSMSVQTACSSSLVAVHYACQSLLSEECELALAGGVTVRVPHAVGYMHREDGVFSADGHCRPFDAAGTGTLFGSGAGVVILRRLEDALADGDRVYAVIRGSAVNNDGGKKAAFTAPSVEGQAAVIAEALAVADVEPQSISYVEAHGTATPLGDPIEFTALERAMGGEALAADRDARCAIGSVKSNLGHLELAAGIAGLIKTALALAHGEIPPSLHFENPNPHIPFDRSRFYVNAELAPWTRQGGPRRAGLSSFGIGGTNAHLVLEEAPPRPARNPHGACTRPAPVILPLSARSASALRSVVAEYKEFIAGSAEGIGDIAYSAAMRRTHHERHRLAVVGRTPEALINALDAVLSGEGSGELGDVDRASAAGCSKGGQTRKIVFAFPGQGSQWLGMGRTLLAEEPAFRQAMERCDAAVRAQVGWSPLAELAASAEASRMQRIDVVQPLLFAMQVSLAALWQSWGITADAVVGFSMGEVAAAHIAGALSLDDAARIICRRSRLALRVTGQGGMAAVGLSLADTEAALARGPVADRDTLSIAASSSPHSTVVAGDDAALDRLAERLKADNVFVGRIRVDFASHSPQVDCLRSDLMSELRPLQPRQAQIPMYSTVYGRTLTGHEVDAAYWVRNLRDPVMFSPAVAELCRGDEPVVFIEMSPHPVLISAIEESIAHYEVDAMALPSGWRDGDESCAMRVSLATLYARGYPVDFGHHVAPEARCVSLPAYPWQRQRHWLEAEARTAAPSDEILTGHWLIGRRKQTPMALGYFESTWTETVPALLAEHRVFERVVVPGAMFAATMIAAAREMAGKGNGTALSVRDLDIHNMCKIDDDEGRMVHTIVRAGAGGVREVQVASMRAANEDSGAGPDESSDDAAWTFHAQGIIASVDDPDDAGSLTGGASGALWPGLDAARARCGEGAITGQDLRQRMHAAGYHLGTSFHWLETVALGQSTALATLRPARDCEFGGDTALIGLIDGCFQLLGLAAMGSIDETSMGDSIYLPAAVSRISLPHGCELAADVAYAWAVTHHDAVQVGSGGQGHHHPADMITGDVCLVDKTGRTLIAAEGVTLQPVSRAALKQRLFPLDAWMHELAWRPASVDGIEEHTGARRWLLFPDRGGVGEKLVCALQSRGDVCVVAQKSTPGVHHPLGLVSTASNGPCSEASVTVRTADEVAAWMAGGHYDGVLYLAGLDAAYCSDGEDVPAMLQSLSSELLAVIQAVTGYGRGYGNEHGGANARLWVATQGAQEARGSISSPVAAVLWGLGRVAAHEHPGQWGGLIDLDPKVSGDDCVQQFVSALGAQWRQGAHMRELAWRDDALLAPALVRAKAKAHHGQTKQGLDAVDGLELSRGGTYLVTGGLGGLGQVIARRLLERGAGAVVAVGRSKDNADNNAPSAMEDRLHVIQGDVADADAVRDILQRIRDTLPPLRGVVHAAGVLDDGMLVNQTPERVAHVLAGKAVGAWNLHRLTSADPLDFLVLFSSTAALLGPVGQGPYAAANAFLDQLAWYRRQSGQCAMSLAWGPWSQVGLAAGFAAQAQAQGLSMMTPEEGAQAFESAIVNDAGHRAITRAKWAHYAAAAGLDTPLLVQLLSAGASAADRSASDEASRVPGPAAHASREPVLRERLLQLAAHERPAMLRSHIADLIDTLLGIRVDEVNMERGLFELGLDSLRAVELRNRLQRGLGCSLSTATIFQHPSIVALTTHLLTTLFPDEAIETSAANANASQASAAAAPVEVSVEASVEATVDSLEPGDARSMRAATMAMRRARRVRGR